MTTAIRCRSLLAAGILALAPLAAPAQSYPDRAIRLILPFPPGGPSDILGRAVGQKLGELMNANVVPDNRAGAGGNIGLEAAARAEPDGYTIAVSSPAIALSPALYRKLNYDGDKDLAPIARLATLENVLVVHPVVPAKTLQEFIALAKNNPGKLNYGSGGAGTTNHLANELLKTLTGVEMVHVPYKGATRAALALISGEVDEVIVSVASSKPFIDQKKVRPLAVLSTERVAVLPDVPTAAEAGLPQFQMSIWYGLFAPAGVPRDIASRLTEQTLRALNSPDLRKRLEGVGYRPWPGGPGEMAELVRTEKARYAKIVEAAGIPKR